MSWTNYPNKTGKLNSLYTILLWGLPTFRQIENLHKELEIINKFVKNPYKRKRANDKIFNFIQYIEESYTVDEIINAIFFIDDTIKCFNLIKKEISVCQNWEINNIIMKYNDSFEIDYLYDLLYNIKLTNVIQINNKVLHHFHYNTTKIKKIKKIEIFDLNHVENYINNIDCGIIYGISSYLKKINNNKWIIKSGKMTKEQILEIMLENEVTVIQQKLETEVFNNLTNPKYNNLFVFGKKNVQTAIDDCLLKELYITKKLKQKLEKNISKDKLNFTIYQLAKLKNNDITDVLIKDYGGLVGVYYYPQNII